MGTGTFVHDIAQIIIIIIIIPGQCLWCCHHAVARVHPGSRGSQNCSCAFILNRVSKFFSSPVSFRLLQSVDQLFPFMHSASDILSCFLLVFQVPQFLPCEI